MGFCHVLTFLAWLLLGSQAALHAGETLPVSLVAEPARVELALERQKLVFTRTNGVFVLSTFVRDGTGWRAMLDAGRPLLEGSHFNLHPTRYAVLADTPERALVEFRGEHRQPDYDWAMRVGMTAGDPLFRFVLTCHLREPLVLASPQPVVALWMRQSNAAFHLDQGPDSIYGRAGIPHGYGFPAAYLWDDRREAAVFFNMTPMRWMQPDGVARFHDVRIMTRSESGQTGLGMHFKKLSGRRLPAGEMVVEFFLHQGVREVRPSGMEALDGMMQAFAPLHPSESVFPRNQFTGEWARWDLIARQAMADLSAPQFMAGMAAPWRDEPLALVPAQGRMVVHPTAEAWDFSTVNNHLTPWLLLARLHQDAAALRLGLQKMDALPRFYDPRAQLIRHGTRSPAHVGDLEMSWQNFFFHQETLRAASAAGAGDFNPAVAGRFLMATAGLRDLARKTEYVFPQWFDPYQKQPVVQNDLKQLGVVREPWQAGSYACLMVKAFEITAQKEYLTEARRAIEALMEGMEFRVRNEVYDLRYTNVVEFPVTELFGNAYGIAASYRLYEVTRNPKFLRYSRDFMNTLLRLTFWYEDETTPVSRELRSAGLFYPHGGAHVATPWETAEAHLMMTWALKHDPGHPLTGLLLKLSNLNRVNAFHFFPVTWTAPVLALEGKPRTPAGACFPIEPFYSLEGTGGHRGGTASYMAGLALWNAWLYEALAEATDREILVLNLDAMEGYESALSGVERHHLIYNPTTAPRSFRLIFKHLPEADYLVSLGPEVKRLPAAALQKGLSLTLKPGAHSRITVQHGAVRERQQRLEQRTAAENALAHAYQLLQERAVARGASSLAPQEIATFTEALSACRDGRHVDAEAKAKGICNRLLQDTALR